MNGPGRPRLYQSDAMKVEAYRKRIESAGYLRKAVLVTQETAALLQWLADTHGASTSDVAGALLEYGLQHYRGEHLVADGSTEADVMQAADADGEVVPAVVRPGDPVQAFIARRKGASK